MAQQPNNQGKDSQSVKKTDDIRDLIQSPEYKRQFAIALPKHLKPERFIRIALTAIAKTPALANCTKASLVSCLLDLSALGLEPDGRRAHLIPFRKSQTNETICTLLIDYKGLVELAMNTGEVSNIHADVICAKDHFSYNMGNIERHEIDFTQDRGVMYAAYCIITMKDGTKKAEVMTKAEIDGVRQRSKAKDSGPWVTDYNEMAKKTVFRRASKWIKLSPEVREKIEKTDEQEFDFSEAIPANTIVGLKHDKNAPQKQETIDTTAVTDGEALTAGEDGYLNPGDISRFGQDAQKAQSMIANVVNIANKIGKEKYLKVLGSCGLESLATIDKKDHLVKLVNELLKEAQEK